MYYPTPNYLRKCFDTADNGPEIKATGQVGNINISSIITKLIQETGRFTENYASDLLYDIDHVIAMTEKHKVMPGENVIIGFGIRENGVDGNSFLMNRLKDSLGYYGYPDYARNYRKIYAVRIRNRYKQPNMLDGIPDCEVILRDITHSLNKMDERDKTWNPDEDVKAYLEKHDKNYAGLSEEEANCYAVRKRPA